MQWATEEQKQRWLVPQARGEKLATFGADRAGRRHGRRQPLHDGAPRRRRYVLNGSKLWISLADIADHFLVFATVDRSRGPPRHHGVPARAGHGRPHDRDHHGKLGIHAGNTGQIFLDDVRVPCEHRIGEEGEGFTIAMSAIDQGRYTVATRCRRSRPGLPRRLGRVRPRAPDVRRGDRAAPARQADDREDGRRASRRAGCSAARSRGSRTVASATRARRASRSGSAPTTRSSRRWTRSRSTAPTATPTSTPSSATCATRRRPSSTRARASCTRSSRPTTCSAIARTSRCGARRSRRGPAARRW